MPGFRRRYALRMRRTGLVLLVSVSGAALAWACARTDPPTETTDADAGEGAGAWQTVAIVERLEAGVPDAGPCADARPPLLLAKGTNRGTCADQTCVAKGVETACSRLSGWFRTESPDGGCGGRVQSIEMTGACSPVPQAIQEASALAWQGPVGSGSSPCVAELAPMAFLDAVAVCDVADERGTGSCVRRDGDYACPAAFPERELFFVASTISPTSDCEQHCGSSKGDRWSSVACKNPRIVFASDSSCTQDLRTVPLTSACVPVPPENAPGAFARYEAEVGGPPECRSYFSKSHNFGPSGQEQVVTMCCR